MDDETPKARRLTLKPKEIVQTETVAQTGDGTAISIKLMHLENRNAAEKPADTTGTRFAEREPRQAPIPFKPRHPAEDPEPDPAPGGEIGEEISVHEMLQANRVAAAEPEVIAMPRKRPSRRNRDFMLLVGCAAAATGVLLFAFRENRELVGLGMFIIVFLTVILAWIMYGVMDRY
ncbi:MAG TPA: hypothetical protein VFE25_07130 [Opitutaceae bacterium]|jgi:hypothetical protein|nr:hypothetical protein [Opitutaceae bacterium]